MSEQWPARLLGLALCVGRLRGQRDPETRALPYLDLTDDALLLLARRGYLVSLAEWGDRGTQLLARFVLPLKNGKPYAFRWTVKRPRPIVAALEAFPVPRVTEAEELAAGRAKHNSKWRRYAGDDKDAARFIMNVLRDVRCAPDAPGVEAFTHSAGREVAPKGPNTTEHYGPHSLRFERRRRLVELRELAASSGGVRVVHAEPAACALCGETGRRFAGLAVQIASVTLCPGCAHGVDESTPRLLRRAVRAEQRAAWDERGGPRGRWPVNLVSTYLGDWFE